MKRIDLPPIWLLGTLMLAWMQQSHLGFGLSFGGAWAQFAGGLFVGAGCLLIALAVVEFWRHRTTVIPHNTPTSLIQSGIFSRTRNPIYLGDALVLTGLILYWDAVLSLPLIPIFVWVIERRFILTEEDRMRRAFGAEFARYTTKTRRWV